MFIKKTFAPQVISACIALWLAVVCFGCENKEPYAKDGHIIVACVDTAQANLELEQAFKLAVGLSQPLVNRDGAPFGITVVSLAIQNTPADAEKGFERAVDMYSPHVIVGGSNIEQALPMSRLAGEYKIPLLTTLASSSENGMGHTFMTSPATAMYAESTVHYLLNNMKLTSLGVLDDNSNPFTIEISNSVRQSYALSGGSELSHFSLQSPDEFAKGVKKLARDNPDCIFVATLDYELSEVIAELKKNGYKGVLFSGAPLDAVEPFTNKPVKLDMPVYFIFYWSEDYTGEVNRSFLRLLRKESELAPSERLAISFDTALRLIAALKSSSGVTSPSDIQNALAGLTSMTGAAGNYCFTSSQTLKSCWVFKLENGALTRQAELTPQTAQIH